MREGFQAHTREQAQLPSRIPDPGETSPRQEDGVCIGEQHRAREGQPQVWGHGVERPCRGLQVSTSCIREGPAVLPPLPLACTWSLNSYSLSSNDLSFENIRAQPGRRSACVSISCLSS